MNASDSDCLYEKIDDVEIRFWLIAVVGQTIALIGIVFNLVLLCVLFSKTLRSTYLIYLGALSITDNGILITYVMIFPPQIMIDYFEWEFLYHVWLRYVPYLYSFSRIVTVASSYLIVFCSLERYLEVVQVRRKRVFISISHRQRYVNITCIVVLSILFRIISIWEVQLESKPECPGFASESLVLTPMAMNWYYRKIYQLWLVHLFQVFFPFTILVIANVLISVGWKKVAQGSTMISIKKPYSEIRHSTSTARRMLIAIVTTYLVSNLLNIIMTIWEHIDLEFLISHQRFYSFSTDVVSLLTSLNASLRLPIYFFTNWRIRKGLRKLWRKVRRRAGSFLPPL